MRAGCGCLCGPHLLAGCGPRPGLGLGDLACLQGGHTHSSRSVGAAVSQLLGAAMQRATPAHGLCALSVQSALLCPSTSLPCDSYGVPHPLSPVRFTRIQQEAGIKSSSAQAAEAGYDMGGDGDDAAAAAVLSKSGGLAHLLDELLEGDFDPDAYDKRMAAAFDDEYYQVCCVLVLVALCWCWWPCAGARSRGCGVCRVEDGKKNVVRGGGSWQQAQQTDRALPGCVVSQEAWGILAGACCSGLALKLCCRPVPCVPAVPLLLLPTAG